MGVTISLMGMTTDLLLPMSGGYECHRSLTGNDEDAQDAGL